METASPTHRWARRAVFSALTTAVLMAGALLGGMAGDMMKSPAYSNDTLFSELPLDDLNTFSEESMVSGYFDLLGDNGGDVK